MPNHRDDLSLAAVIALYVYRKSNNIQESNYIEEPDVLVTKEQIFELASKYQNMTEERFEKIFMPLHETVFCKHFKDNKLIGYSIRN